MPTFKVQITVSAQGPGQERMATSRLVQSASVLDAYRLLADALRSMDSPPEYPDAKSQ